MHKFTLYLKVTARRLSNPVFFMLLGLSLILWYVTKLSHSYTADINIPVRIDSVYYSVSGGRIRIPDLAAQDRSA